MKKFFESVNLKDTLSKVKANTQAATETWKGFYDIAPGDKFEKILIATQKTYSVYNKIKGK